MKYDRTDKIISSKYLSQEPSFDVESAWNNLEPKIVRKKRRRFGILYFIGFSGLILLVIYQTSIWNVEIDSETMNTRIVESSGTSLESTALSSQAETVKGNNNEAKSTLSAKTAMSYSVDTDSKDKVYNENLLNTNESIEKGIEYVSKIEVREINKVNDIKEVSNSQNGFSLAEASKVADYNLGGVNTKRQLVSMDLLATELKSIEYNRIISDLDAHAFLLPIGFESDKHKIRFGVFGGYFIHSRSLEHSGVGSNGNYTNRSNEEQAIDAFDLGLKLDYFVSNNLVVFGGLRYDQSFVERNADYIYLNTITIEDHVIEVIETEEGTIEKTETVTYDGYYSHVANNYVTTKRLGVLAGLQYRIGKGKWKSHINLGVELPVWTGISGIITNDGKSYNLSTGDLKIAKIQPLIFGGVGAEYSLADGVGLQLMIGGYLPTGNEYQESYNINKKSAQLGLNFGVHFQL